jgi:hypothetical protein
MKDSVLVLSRKKTALQRRLDRRSSVNKNSVERPIRENRESTIRLQMNNFTQSFDISAATGITGAMVTTISQFPLATNILSVFDQYRIMRVTYTFVPTCVTSFIAAGSPTTLVPTAVYNPGVLCTCVDQNDGNAPANENVVLSHESAIVHGPFVKQFSRTYTPMTATEVYQTGGFGGYAASLGQWVDTGSTNVQYYSTKFAVSHGAPGPTGTALMLIYCSIIAEFRKTY